VYNMNVSEIITARILEKMDQGIIPWKKPWACSSAGINLNTMKEYNGINRILTGMAGFSSPYWLTFNQVKEKGGQVVAGSKGTPIVYFNQVEKENEDGETSRRGFLRYYTVFNMEQTAGIDYPKAETIEHKPIQEAENIAHGFVGGPEVNHGGDRACYVPSLDVVKMPPRSTFEKPEMYYSVLFHELTHSTGSKGRLNRDELLKYNYNTDTRSREELTAEIGAAFLCHACGIIDETITDSAAYIQSWKQHLKDNPNWLVSAAARAQKSFDWIMNNRPGMKESLK
jgi:antirestriction protein ArdC